MNQEVLKRLRNWREQKARLENCELYRVFQNKTIEDIAMLLPKTKNELLAIKGIREKKFQKYGKDVLAIIHNCLGTKFSEDNTSEEGKTYTVSDYLDNVNSKLSTIESCKVKGEVSSVNFKGHLYFSLKDKNDESILRCFMWANDYKMCGVEVKEGMELTIHGTPEIYKPRGDFSFRTSAVELVGEGALKRAYEELKNKLQTEGLFEESRKKPIPDYPRKIGLITSRDGAVISDFMSNIGRFGYKITFMDSRVEGIMAVKDLIKAVKYFQDKPVDVLAIIRGGGSLESLQAFNNEALIREVANLNFPVICGIGHDKDVPLLSFLADSAVSTPTAVAQTLNESWENAIHKVKHCEQNIVASFDGMIMDSRNKFEKVIIQIKEFHSRIFRIFEQHEHSIKNYLVMIKNSIMHTKERLRSIANSILIDYRNNLNDINRLIDNMQKTINMNNPERQLKLGYSIVFSGRKIIKNTEQVKVGDNINVKVSDGEIKSKVKNISKN